MTKRPGDKGGDPGGNAEKRRRLFEQSRGLEEERLLDLDEAASEEESEEQPDEGGAPPADKD
jgi:hypothetical protein